MFIVRDLVGEIDTRGKWVDVISLSTYSKRNSEYRKAFNWIIVELFPRRLTPEYDKKDSAHNKYLTWVVAHEDIEYQRQAGYQGEKYVVLCNLYNRNKNKFTTQSIFARKYWEPEYAYREMKVKKELNPDWEYKIQAVKQVNNKQVCYINKHSTGLEEKIRANGRPTLGILGVG